IRAGIDPFGVDGIQMGFPIRLARPFVVRRTLTPSPHPHVSVRLGRTDSWRSRSALSLCTKPFTRLTITIIVFSSSATKVSGPRNCLSKLQGPEALWSFEDEAQST